MQIGIISDTHGFLSPSVFNQFKDVEQIFHAGDIGGIEIIKQLEQIAPVRAVCGNMDDWNIKRNFPPVLFSAQADKIICLVHDIGNKKKFCYELFKKNQKAVFISRFFILSLAMRSSIRFFSTSFHTAGSSNFLISSCLSFN